MILRDLIWKVLKEDLDLQIANLKNKYVGEGKSISEEEFNRIMESSLGKTYLITWLTKKVGTGVIKAEDIYKWKEYFEIFEKNKSKFEKKDIHLYKTPEDVKEFISAIIKVRESGIPLEEIPDSEEYVSKNDIAKLESTGGAKYLGMWKDYQVFRVFDSSEKTWKLYRDILGRCRGRSKGAKIELCTIADYEWFRNYLKGRGLKDYILLFNLKDPLSPYQLHVKSGQFFNKNDVDDYNFKPALFLSWLEKKLPEYSIEKVKKSLDMFYPAEDKGYFDEKDREQGVFEYIVDGRKSGAFTFVNGRLSGPYIKYSGVGKQVSERGNYKNEEPHGPYVKYSVYGDIITKGEYKNGDYVGVWRIPVNTDTFSITHGFIDYGDSKKFPESMSGMSGNDLVFISGWNEDNSPTGKTTIFYPNGKINAVGRLTSKGKATGKWTIYFPDGTIKAEGVYQKNKKNGDWVEYVEYRNKKYKFDIDYSKRTGKILIGYKFKIRDMDGKKVEDPTKTYVAKTLDNKLRLNWWD